MSDNADLANDVMQARLDLLLQNRPRLPSGISASECEECGDDIPQARRVALPGIQTCAECAQLIEEQTRFQRGG
jgi:phage/conjugal plasmid C-4 type zinc finger protein, TraR family